MRTLKDMNDIIINPWKNLKANTKIIEFDWEGQVVQKEYLSKGVIRLGKIKQDTNKNNHLEINSAVIKNS